MLPAAQTTNRLLAIARAIACAISGLACGEPKLIERTSAPALTLMAHYKWVCRLARA